MAVTASFLPGAGILLVFGDNLGNTIEIKQDALQTGKILVNNGAVAIQGGTPTVANTALIQVFGQGGNDTITLNEANGPPPVCSAAPATTCCAAARATTCSLAKAATTRCSARAASTSSLAAKAMTR